MNKAKITKYKFKLIPFFLLFKEEWINLPSQIKGTQNIFSNDNEFKWKKLFIWNYVL